MGDHWCTCGQRASFVWLPSKCEQETRLLCALTRGNCNDCENDPGNAQLDVGSVGPLLGQKEAALGQYVAERKVHKHIIYICNNKSSIIFLF